MGEVEGERTVETRGRKLGRVLLREHLARLSGNIVDALILELFIGWSKQAQDRDELLLEDKRHGANNDVPLQQGWASRSASEIRAALFGLVGRGTIARGLQRLVHAGWLSSRRNPDNPWDRTLQYRLNVKKLEQDLAAQG